MPCGNHCLIITPISHRAIFGTGYVGEKLGKLFGFENLMFPSDYASLIQLLLYRRQATDIAEQSSIERLKINWYFISMVM